MDDKSNKEEEPKDMTIRELAALNPSPGESIAFGQNLAKNFLKKINWRNVLIWTVSIAMIILIIYLICNMQYVKMNPLDYCEKALNASGCYCPKIAAR